MSVAIGVWRVPVASHGTAFGWSSDGIAIAYDDNIAVVNESSTLAITSDVLISGHTLSLQDNMVVAVTDDGRAACFPLDNSIEGGTLSVHGGAGTAVIAAGTEILTAGSDGSIALIRRRKDNTLTEAGRLTRRLRCSGARVDRMKRERERLIFLANEATDD